MEEERTSPLSAASNAADGSPLRPMRPQRSSARPRGPSRAPSSTAAPETTHLYDAPVISSPVGGVTSSRALPQALGSVYQLPEPVKSSPSPNASPTSIAPEPSHSTAPLQLRGTSPASARSVRSSPTQQLDNHLGQPPTRRLSENQLGKLPMQQPSPPVTSHWSPHETLAPLQTSPDPLDDNRLDVMPTSAQSVYSAESARAEHFAPWQSGSTPPLGRDPSFTGSEGASIPSRRSSLRRSFDSGKLKPMENGGPLSTRRSSAKRSQLDLPTMAEGLAEQNELALVESHSSIVSESHSSVDMSSILAAYAEGTSPTTSRSMPDATSPLGLEGPPTARATEFPDAAQAYRFADDVPVMQKMPTSSSNASIELLQELDKAIGESIDPGLRLSAQRASVRQSMDLPVDAYDDEGSSNRSPVPPSIAFSSPPDLKLDLPSQVLVAENMSHRSLSLRDGDGASSVGHAMSTDHSESNYEEVAESVHASLNEHVEDSTEDHHGDVSTMGTSREPSVRPESSQMPRTTSLKSQGLKHQSNGLDLSQLVGKRSLPHAAHYRDIPSMRSTSDRAAAYAQRINQLSKEDTGLSTWISFVRQRGKQGTLPPLRGYSRRTSAQSSLRIDGSRSVSYAGSIMSDAEFPMRGGAGRAQDLSTSAVPPSPSSSVHTVPYPQLVPGASTGVIHHSSSTSSLTNPMQHRGSGSSSLFGLGRKQSKRSGSGRPAISNPTLIRSTSGNGPSGPRPLEDEARPTPTKRASVQTSLSNVMEAHAKDVDETEVDKLAEILPGAHRTELRGYLAREGGRQADAISAYMRDHPA